MAVAASAHEATNGYARLLRKNGEALPDAAIEELEQFKSELVIKGRATDEVYRAAIHRWNEAFIEEASIVAFCETDDDIRFCLQYVQKWGLALAIAGGRHSYHGASSTTGLVIDTRKLNKVVIDKDAMTVTAGSGCKARDLENPLCDMGLAIVMGQVSDTGIAGITLGGGSGPLSGKHGHVVDNLLCVKMVLADGRSVTASEDSNPDLFWATRGGGSNFGIVTEFKYRVHQQGPVYFGPLVFTPDKIDAILDQSEFLLKTAAASAGKLSMYSGFTQFPGMPAVHPIVIIMYDGTEEEAKTLLAPIFDLEPVANKAEMGPWTRVTNLFGDGLPTHQHYTVGNFMMPQPLDLAVYKSLVREFSAFVAKYGPAVGPSKILIEWRATRDRPVASTALGGRSRATLALVEGQYDPSIPGELVRKEILGMLQRSRDQVSKLSEGKPEDKTVYFHANIVSGQEKVEKMFGENLPRLRELKKKYDPKFVFNKWFPIDPNGA